MHPWRMETLKRAVPWLLVSFAALAAGFADVDLRLIAACTCGAAVLAGSGALDAIGRRAPRG